MARRLRVEVAGGLYHLIARGNDRQDIFHSPEERHKFLALLLKEKVRSPFFLYAYCLMTNHIHLLLERQAETVGNIMQRVLGGYSRYYNRRYKHVGHVFQGRHKAILCQSDKYLAELVRYIHLNPVQGMNALQLTYTPKGGVSRQVAFATSTPIEVVIEKADPLEPENGVLQGQFYKKNAPFGSPSAQYPITLG